MNCSINQKSGSDELPLFCMYLQDGTMVTCYEKEEVLNIEDEASRMTEQMFNRILNMRVMRGGI